MANCSAARIASHAASPTFSPAAEPPVRTGSAHARIHFDHLGERSVRIAYEAHGPPAAPATVVLGGISAGRHLAPSASDPTPGWWPGVVGQGAVLDPARRSLIGIDYLGGTSEDGVLRPVTTHDQARAIGAVLDELGIAAASFVGSSYGGMAALAFAELFPERAARLVVFCAAHRTHPMATGIRSVQRAAASLGVATGRAGRGLALARALAMTTYRSAREFEERFAPDPLAPDPLPPNSLASDPLAPRRPGQTPVRFPVEEYLEARGADFVRRFDAERFLALSESIDLHRTRPGSLPPQTLLVSFDTDALVPPWLVDELATRSGRRGRGPTHVTVPSLFGHDAFLKEVGEVTALLSAGTPEVVR